MSDGLTIQSHTGPYGADFDDEALQKLNAAPLAGLHFIIDARVAELYASAMGNILASSSVLLVEALEGNKSLEKMPGYVAHLMTKNLRHDHTLIAIGGGIIQDITCFLGATMLRGVEWQFYPTTLLAQADSCIGSKSSINSGHAKNILGTFTPPRQVSISVSFLSTLDQTDVRSGIGEMIKVHVIDGPGSFDAIAADYNRILTEPIVMADYIRRSLKIKQRYIEEDEFDRGPRNIFNYGHSFGHAIEAATNFTIPHGIAVTIGMDMANYMSWQLGNGSEDNFHRMHMVLKSNSAGFESVPVPEQSFLEALSKDKKNVGTGSVALILVDGKGDVAKGNYKTDDTFRAHCHDYLTQERLA